MSGILPSRSSICWPEPGWWRGSDGGSLLSPVPCKALWGSISPEFSPFRAPEPAGYISLLGCCCLRALGVCWPWPSEPEFQPSLCSFSVFSLALSRFPEHCLLSSLALTSRQGSYSFPDKESHHEQQDPGIKQRESGLSPGKPRSFRSAVKSIVTAGLAVLVGQWGWTMLNSAWGLKISRKKPQQETGKYGSGHGHFQMMY